MLAAKGIEPKVTDLPPGLHHRIIRLLGFPRPTVPAMKVDGRKVQGTREIARALDELVPEPPLFPADPSARAAVEEAERWADEELQDTPRRILRLSGARSQAFRRWMAKEIVGLPLPGVAGALGVPDARRLAKVVDADEPMVRRELAELPATIGRIEALISDGVIGGERPNAADFQIASSMRQLLALDRVGPAIDGGPAAAHARRLFPHPYRAEPIPWVLPDEWLEPLGA
jgi:glutathione S-transferase